MLCYVMICYVMLCHVMYELSNFHRETCRIFLLSFHSHHLLAYFLFFLLINLNLFRCHYFHQTNAAEVRVEDLESYVTFEIICTSHHISFFLPAHSDLLFRTTFITCIILLCLSCYIILHYRISYHIKSRPTPIFLICFFSSLLFFIKTHATIHGTTVHVGQKDVRQNDRSTFPRIGQVIY